VNQLKETVQNKLDAYLADKEKADTFLELAKKYTDFTELTPQMLYEFIEKIDVHRAEKTEGERSMQVDIYLKYIGNFPIPHEYEGDPPEQEKNHSRRAYYREYKQKKKAQMIAEAQ